MVEFCLEKEKEKPLGPGDQWPRENYILWSENESPINCVYNIRDGGAYFEVGGLKTSAGGASR